MTFFSACLWCYTAHISCSLNEALRPKSVIIYCILNISQHLCSVAVAGVFALQHWHDLQESQLLKVKRTQTHPLSAQVKLVQCCHAYLLLWVLTIMHLLHQNLFVKACFTSIKSSPSWSTTSIMCPDGFICFRRSSVLCGQVFWVSFYYSSLNRELP